MQEVEAIALGGIAKVDDGNSVAVAVFCDASVIAKNVAFGIGREKRHPAGQRIFQAGIKPVGRLANTRRANHDGVNIAGVD